MRVPWLVLLLVVSMGCAQGPAGAAARQPAAAAGSTPSALDLLATTIGRRRLVLLGETHGTREIPALVGELVQRESRRGRQVVLALEISEADQAIVDRYLASAGTAADRQALLAGTHWTEPHHDGRDSQAMAALIEGVRRLRARGHDVAILLFDPLHAADRDRGMADRLRGALRRAPRAQFLVLTGNVHAMTRRPPWSMVDEAGRPIEPPISAGRHLADLQPLSIDIEALRGTAWNCMDGDCTEHPYRSRPATLRAPSVEVTPDPAASAWDAMLLLPAFTASPPAIGGVLAREPGPADPATARADE